MNENLLPLVKWIIRCVFDTNVTGFDLQCEYRHLRAGVSG